MNAIVRTATSKWPGNARAKPKRASAGADERFVEKLAGAEKVALQAP